MRFRLFNCLLLIALICCGCATTRVETHKINPEQRAKLEETGLTPAAIIPKSCATIEYPEESRRMREEGRAIAIVYTDVIGSVIKVQIHKTSGFPNLDAATIAWLSSCRFTPAIKNGIPVAMWTPIGYTWKIAN